MNILIRCDAGYIGSHTFKLDQAVLKTAFAAHAIDVVVQFAACSIVAKSVRDPAPFFRHNVTEALASYRTRSRGRPDVVVLPPREGDPAVLAANNYATVREIKWDTTENAERLRRHHTGVPFCQPISARDCRLPL